jgi:cell division protease FtsH
VAYGENQEEIFMGMSRRQNAVSEATARTIDSEVRRIVDEALREAKRILSEKSEQLTAVAEALIERETLTGEDIRALMSGAIPEPQPTPPPQVSGVPSIGRDRP